jgi:molybdopterin-guanine dinucleotide biosynthesis protein
MTIANKLGLGLRGTFKLVGKTLQKTGSAIKNTTTDFALGVQGKDSAVIKQAHAAQFVAKRRGKVVTK